MHKGKLLCTVFAFDVFCRQRKLEEGLLLSGQFTEALDALLDWLAKVEPALADDAPVHGDIDTVNGFLDIHKASTIRGSHIFSSLYMVCAV